MYFIFKMSQILIFALKFVGPFQEKTTQTQSFRRKKSKEKLPRKFPKPHTISVFHKNGYNHRQNALHT